MQKIKANGARYISEIPEFKEGLPHGIFNKKKTDSGGTFAAMSCKLDYIVVVPFRDTVDSITSDPNLPYSPFRMYSGSKYREFKDYIVSSTSPKKFVVTYDSLQKLIEWLEKCKMDLQKFKVLVDEFHILLEDFGFRHEAINKVLKIIEKFPHYTFMSATPINENFLTNMLEELPYTEIEWDYNQPIRPTRINTPNVYKATVKIINSFLDGGMENLKLERQSIQELYIFMNSVEGIKIIIDNSKLKSDEVKVVCADNVRNSVVLKDIPIKNITSPNAKVNFLTKKGFQGCNLFSKSGLVLVVSDGKRANTLVDIETTLHQIAGRLRTNEEYNNPFKDEIWHIYSTRKDVKTPDEFKLQIEKKQNETKDIISSYQKLDSSQKTTFRERILTDDLFCYYDENTDSYIESELKLRYYEYRHNIIDRIYKNGHSVREAYQKVGLPVEKQEYLNIKEVMIKKITHTGFREMIELYIELKTNGSGNAEEILKLESEYLLFKKAFDVLGKRGIKSCGYIQEKIISKLKENDSTTLNIVYKRFFDEVGENRFITNEEAKSKLKEIYNKLNIANAKPTVAMLHNSKIYEVKKTQRRIEGKQKDGVMLFKKAS